MLMKTRYASSYWKEFSCLGAECPDTCCSGWKVPISVQDMAMLKKKAPKLIPIMVQPMKNNPDPHYFSGELKMKDQSCVMLHQGWCKVVHQHGDDALPSVCHDFPRILYDYGTHQETYLSTACPASARLMLNAPRSLEEAPLYGFKEVRNAVLTEDDNNWNHREFASIIIDTLPNPTLWAVLSLWCKDLESNPMATLDWSDTLAEDVPDIAVKPWLEGQHHMMNFLFKRHLKQQYTGFQGHKMQAIVNGYSYDNDDATVFRKYEEAYTRFHNDPELEHAMRQFVYFEMLRLGFPVQQGITPHEQLAVLAYMWVMIRWLGFGYALFLDRPLTREEWGDMVYLHGRWYHHNASYQELHKELRQSEGWSSPEKILGLVS